MLCRCGEKRFHKVVILKTKTMWKYRITILLLVLGFIAILTSIGTKQNEQPKVVTIHDTITDIKLDTPYTC